MKSLLCKILDHKLDNKMKTAYFDENERVYYTKKCSRCKKEVKIKK
jgi:hypothetical protein